MSPPFLLKGPDSNESGPFFCFKLFISFFLEPNINGNIYI